MTLRAYREMNKARQMFRLRYSFINTDHLFISEAQNNWVT